MLRNDPDALAPENLLVFELRDHSLASFMKAVEAIEGLDLVGEEDRADDDEHKNFLYLTIPSQAAIGKLLALWNLWIKGKPLPDDAANWPLVFECLHDLRRWGPKDRISEEDAQHIADQAGLDPDATVRIEVELVFDRRARESAQLRLRAEAALVAGGGRIVHRARIEPIAYDALLVDVSAAQAKALVDRDSNTLAGIPDLYAIRPQSLIDVHDDAERSAVTPIPEAEPTDAAIAAILDAVPVQNHPAFQNHIDVVDPDDLEGRAAGIRSHGTAMVSLVVRGDLKGNEAPLTRRVVFRPVMFASRAGDPEGFDRDKLVVDGFVRAVQGLKKQPGASAPDVFVINISLGDRSRPFSGRVSAWARALDWLAHEHGILFVVSAGNASGGIELVTLKDDADYAKLLGADRARATLSGIAKALPHRRMLSPAEAVNALTVGALHQDELRAPPTVGASHDPLPVQGLATPASRFGPGVANAIKPDLLLPGGRLRVTSLLGQRPPMVRISPANARGGLQVASGVLDALGRPTSNAWSGATSGAAALATRAAHLVHDALLSAYPADYGRLPARFKALLVKSLLLHRCEIGKEARALVEEVFGPPGNGKHMKRADNIYRMFGNGAPRIDEVVACLSNRATLWGAGSVGEDAGLLFKVPLPPSLSGHVGLRRLSVTLVWFTAVTPGRRAYRSERLIVEEPAKDHLRQVLTKVEEHQAESKRVSRGTVFTRCWYGKGARQFVAGANFEIRVVRKPDSLDDLPDVTDFAFAATLEAGDPDLPIYEEVRARIAIQPRVPVVVRVPAR